MTKQIQGQVVLHRFKDLVTCQPVKATPLLIPWFSGFLAIACFIYLLLHQTYAANN
jgi:hypothetical protein